MAKSATQKIIEKTTEITRRGNAGGVRSPYQTLQDAKIYYDQQNEGNNGG